MPDPTMQDQTHITRVFDAPRARVFRAWIEAEEVAAWFCPDAFRLPLDRIRIDPRVGGRYELTMVSPDGREMAIGYEIVELVEPELLVLRSDPMPEYGLPEPAVVRVELEDVGGRTRMTLTDGPMPAEMARQAGTGWGQALDKLAARL